MTETRLPLSLLAILLVGVLQTVAQQGIEETRSNAKGGDADAQYRLGIIFREGHDVLQDDSEAFKWFAAAANQGNAKAQAMLGSCYSEGRGVPKNDESAVKWFRSAAEQGNSVAQTMLGYHLVVGRGVLSDDAEAMRWFRKAAEQGEREAQRRLAEGYFNGWGVPKDVTEACKWFSRAADQGDVNAQTMLGSFHFRGTGVRKNYSEAVKWFRRAAQQGDSYAQNNLGVCYESGLGVQKDYAEAIVWFRKAADQGHAAAQAKLGWCYAEGKGIEQDYEEAVKWSLKGAEQGDAMAQYNLALSYLHGEGIRQDPFEAVIWFRKAAEQGNATAQGQLGWMLMNGEGAPQDFVQAYMWSNFAAAQGIPEAITNRNVLAQLMTPGQIAEAQKLSREFKPRRALDESNGLVTLEKVVDSRPAGSGTGFFITQDGFLVTNEHVVRNGEQSRLVTKFGAVPAKIVKVDAANHLALLKAEGGFVALPMVSSRGVKLGDTVATVGFPNIGLQGFSPKLAKGEIASLSGAADGPRYFQISVPVQPGNSGGALVDERGNVVVVSAKLDTATALRATGALPENVNYAIKSSFLLGFLESVPEVSARLKEPNTADMKFEDVVKAAEQAAVLVLVY